jgi:VanZ family protein
MNRKFKFVAFGIWSLVVLYLTLKPGGQKTLDIPHFDLIVHFVLFSTLAATGFLAFSQLFGKPVVFTLAYCIVLAIATEWIQQYVPGRDSNILDLGANLIGTVCGLLFIKKFASWFEHT